MNVAVSSCISLRAEMWATNHGSTSDAFLNAQFVNQLLCGGLQCEGGFENPLIQLGYKITSEYSLWNLFSYSHAGLYLPADLCYCQCENLLVQKKRGAEIMEVP